MGLYFEEFTLDRPVTTRGRTVSEADIVTFAGISGDWNPLHIDEEFSKNAGYGGRIAHGPMSMSMAIELMAQQNLIIMPCARSAAVGKRSARTFLTGVERHSGST